MRENAAVSSHRLWPLLLFVVLCALLAFDACRADAKQIADGIYMAGGISNSYLIVTPNGNVVIDTGAPNTALRQFESLRAVSDQPARYLVLTHAHMDHTAGIELWADSRTEIVAHRNHADEVAYQRRLRGFFARRNAAQFGAAPQRTPAATSRLADITFSDGMEFSLGGLTFVLAHTPGETSDHVSVWIPELEVAFIGDNYYDSFPNISTLRGSRPRWALDYVGSLDRVLQWEPEVVLSGHVAPLRGRAKVTESLTRYRDAILYVHDETVNGMNAGKSVDDMMRSIVLPPELAVGEKYGRVSWSVRGIYEGYVGWFNERPESMYPSIEASVFSQLVELAGGPEAIVARARENRARGDLIEALRLTDAALYADPRNGDALNIREDVLQALEQQAGNFNERAWLKHARRQAQQKTMEE
ncbi:MAG: MBL fold metallo-hydrolase [Gammaproteobacteria bacterium]